MYCAGLVAQTILARPTRVGLRAKGPYLVESCLVFKWCSFCVIHKHYITPCRHCSPHPQSLCNELEKQSFVVKKLFHAIPLESSLNEAH